MSLRYLVWNDKNIPTEVAKYFPFVDQDALALKSQYRTFNMNAKGTPVDGLNGSGTVYQIARILSGHGERHAAIGGTSNKMYIELGTPDDNMTQIVTMDFSKGIENAVIKAGYTTKETGNVIYDDYASLFTGTAIVLGLAVYANLRFNEARERYTNLVSAIDNSTSCSEIARALAAYSETLYALFFHNKEAYVKIKGLPKDKTQSPTAKSLKDHIDSMTIGEFRVFANPQKVEQKKLDISKLALDTSDLSEEDKKLIPSKPNHTISEVASDFATMVKMTAKYDTAIKTAYLVGPAGTGKTVICVDTAHLLNLPYSYKTCDADMDIGDLLYGQVYVNTGTGKNKVTFEDVRIDMGLPSINDITLDPEGAYVSIFKEDMPDGVEEKDIIAAMIEKVSSELSERLKGKDFIYVEGGLVKTARRGGVFEVQEIGIVKRPGVAVGLNAIMESKKNVFITLPNGEVVKKHKNCIIMFTSNDEYDGTANLNQSVLDRLSHVVYFKNPSESTMAMRVKDVVTDWCLGDDLLKEMATRIDEISKFLRENDISDGVCGQRSLNNWAMEIMVKCAINGISNLDDFNRDLNLRNQILRQTCQNTVLNKVSQVAEDIEAVAAGCIDSVYGYLPVRI